MCQEFDETDWEQLLSSDSIDVNWSHFKEKVLSSVNKHVPRITKRPPTNKPLWWNNSIAKAIDLKQQLFSKFRHTHLPSDYVAYAHIRNEVKSLIRAAKAKQDTQLIEKLHTNPKALYGYMRDKSRLKPRIGQLVRPDGTFTTSDDEKAEVLNDFFQSVFTSDHECCTTEISSSNISRPFDIPITEFEVFEVLSLLKPDKAPGPDGLHLQVLKKCAESLAKPFITVCTIYRHWCTSW